MKTYPKVSNAIAKLETKETKGFCNCCGKKVALITHIELGESICKICRSYDVRKAA